MDTEMKPLVQRKIRSSSRIMGHRIPNEERKDGVFRTVWRLHENGVGSEIVALWPRGTFRSSLDADSRTVLLGVKCQNRV